MNNLEEHLKNVRGHYKFASTRWGRFEKWCANHPIVAAGGVGAVGFGALLWGLHTAYHTNSMWIPLATLAVFFSTSIPLLFVFNMAYLKNDTNIDQQTKGQIAQTLAQLHHANPEMKDICARYLELLDQDIPKSWWEKMLRLSEEYLKNPPIEIDDFRETLKIQLDDDDHIRIDQSSDKSMKI